MCLSSLVAKVRHSSVFISDTVSVWHLFFIYSLMSTSLCLSASLFVLLLLLLKLRKLLNGVSLSLSDLQNVNITLRILFRPVATQLPRIFTSIGEDYDERVLPSITTEVLKAVVVSVLQNAVKTCLVLSKQSQEINTFIQQGWIKMYDNTKYFNFK